MRVYQFRHLGKWGRFRDDLRGIRISASYSERTDNFYKRQSRRPRSAPARLVLHWEDRGSDRTDQAPDIIAADDSISHRVRRFRLPVHVRAPYCILRTLFMRHCLVDEHRGPAVEEIVHAKGDDLSIQAIFDHRCRIVLVRIERDRAGLFLRRFGGHPAPPGYIRGYNARCQNRVHSTAPRIRCDLCPGIYAILKLPCRKRFRSSPIPIIRHHFDHARASTHDLSWLACSFYHFRGILAVHRAE